MLLKNSITTFVFLVSILGHSYVSKNEKQITDIPKKNTEIKLLSILDYNKLICVKEKLHSKEFTDVYMKILDNAEKVLNEGPFSVVNKTQTPPSGNKHDYLSLGPYWWPDSNKIDGLPWVRKDGEINPLTRGENVDEPRKDKMFSNVNKLSFAYFFSDDEKYATKLIELLETWFLNSSTKMNPNLNFAQGIPGLNTGRGIGIIEFAGISNVINAIEILELKNVLEESISLGLRNWMRNYLDWLQTSEFGVFEKNTKNNHGTHYDVQITSLLLFLNKNEEAKTYLESVKKNRIDTQIEPDGRQPHELARTKSLSYSTMNLGGFLQLAYLATKVNVDLWHYESENGASIQKAFEFLEPYATSKKDWEYEQITSLEKSIRNLQQLFGKTDRLFGIEGYHIIGKEDRFDDLFYNCD
ncbi:alginate lyase family protein [Aestuariibaculum suncheonense]|uniref:Alginate lyase family protein n=1 Tax=Aestuariibaculum suncheonense TaxID=1028745 RepID=A0A8J6QC20_9FLAO|nr:alginate lyase family protein [Aestuariibaculum suncheonense]MBD0834783.1 alginate lyase family protein [Aestuariibaculum suncheonense]